MSMQMQTQPAGQSSPQRSAVPGPVGEEIRVRGLVQGVGFRPTVWRLAHACGVVGDVRNDSYGVRGRCNISSKACAPSVRRSRGSTPSSGIDSTKRPKPAISGSWRAWPAMCRQGSRLTQ
jgi:hypothetical protein